MGDKLQQLLFVHTKDMKHADCTDRLQVLTRLGSVAFAFILSTLCSSADWSGELLCYVLLLHLCTVVSSPVGHLRQLLLSRHYVLVRGFHSFGVFLCTCNYMCCNWCFCYWEVVHMPADLRSTVWATYATGRVCPPNSRLLHNYLGGLCQLHACSVGW